MFGTRLKIVAKTVFGSLKNMDNAFGKTQGYFSSYISKELYVSPEILFTLLNEYNININWLLAGIGEMYVKLPNKENVEVLESESVKVPIMTNENMSQILDRLNKLEKKLEETEV